MLKVFIILKIMNTFNTLLFWLTFDWIDFWLFWLTLLFKCQFFWQRVNFCCRFLNLDTIVLFIVNSVVLNIVKKGKFIFKLLRIKCCNVLLNVCYFKTSSRYSIAQLNCAPSLFFPKWETKLYLSISTEKSKFYKMANITKVRIVCFSIISMFFRNFI